MGNVSLGVGYVTKIWRLEWDEEELAAANSENNKNNGKALQHQSDSGGDAEGNELRRQERMRWCSIMKSCDSKEKMYHWIVIRHYESGKVLIFVDGAFEGTGHASFNSVTLQYKVGAKRIGMTRIGFNEGSKFAYTYSTSMLLPNGSQNELKELNQQLMNDHDPSILIAQVSSSEVVRAPPKSGDGPSKQVAVYTVVSRVRDGPSVSQKKRFSEFVDLDRLVRSAFSGSHLLSSLPSLPPKQSKVLSNHLESEFIEKRRHGLDMYLKKLLSMPRIPQNPDVLEFLGILPPLAMSNAPPVVVV